MRAIRTCFLPTSHLALFFCWVCTFLGWAPATPATPALRSLSGSAQRGESCCPCQHCRPILVLTAYIEIPTTVPKRSGIYRLGLKLQKKKKKSMGCRKFSREKLSLPIGKCMVGCRKPANIYPGLPSYQTGFYWGVIKVQWARLRECLSTTVWAEDRGHRISETSECQWSELIPLIWLPGVGVSTNPTHYQGY